MKIRIRKRVTGIVACSCVIAATALAWSDWSCRMEIVDVNGCGNYPPPGTCVLINQFDGDRGCCDICQRQHVKKEFYDCDGDGTADCEYDLWFNSFETDCCLDDEDEDYDG